MYTIKVKIRGCKNINSLREFIRSHNIKLILFAETHGDLNELPIQRKIIQNTKPDFFLYEMLEEEEILSGKEAKQFINEPDNKDFSFISTYGQLKPTIKLARSFDLPIIGCDIKNMCCKDKNWINEKFPKGHWKKVTKKRELRQIKVINKYISKGLVFASLGAYHLRKDNLVLSKLRSKKVIVVKPLFNGKEGDRISLKKLKNSEISYIIKEIAP